MLRLQQVTFMALHNFLGLSYELIASVSIFTSGNHARLHCRDPLFPFRKRSLPFLTDYATIGNHAFSHDRCNIFPALSYNKADNTFLNSLKKNDVEFQVEFTFNVMERARVTSH